MSLFERLEEALVDFLDSSPEQRLRSRAAAFWKSATGELQAQHEYFRTGTAFERATERDRLNDRHTAAMTRITHRRDEQLAEIEARRAVMHALQVASDAEWELGFSRYARSLPHSERIDAYRKEAEAEVIDLARTVLRRARQSAAGIGPALSASDLAVLQRVLAQVPQSLLSGATEIGQNLPAISSYVGDDEVDKLVNTAVGRLMALPIAEADARLEEFGRELDSRFDSLLAEEIIGKIRAQLAVFRGQD